MGVMIFLLCLFTIGSCHTVPDESIDTLIFFCPPLPQSKHPRLIPA